MRCRGCAGVSPHQISDAARHGPAVLRNGTRAPFGLAWRLGEIDGGPFAMHDGGGVGYRAEMRVYPRLGYAVAAMGNESSFPSDRFARIILPSPHEQAGSATRAARGP